MFRLFKQLVVGRPMRSEQIEEQRLPKTIALAIFSSDALSSTAYATEEILFVTALGASSLALGLNVLVPIAVVVAILLTIVIVSYRQLIFAYPDGGGAYVVSRENLGEMSGLVAGASLMVDYVLTVAVSISAGVAAIVSIPAFKGLADQRVALGVALIILITLANLRGLKESGRVFAIPTYIYMFVLMGLIGFGLWRSYFGTIDHVPFDAEAFEGARQTGGTLGVFLLLKGFSSGAVALTGVEAISNGVPIFRRPAPKNAATTLVWMGVLLGGLFFGISVLAHHLHPYPSEHQTVMAQMGLAVFGNGPAFVILQFATAAILTLAANTAYNGFPSLASIIAKDSYLPRQLAHRGDRLVFSNGIIILASAAAALLVAFGGLTNALIPLYAVGVFTSFTLSQAGMVVHHLRVRERGYRRNIALNGLGSAATFVVFMIVAVTKFTNGAWLPLVVIPAIVFGFKSIHRHYERVESALDPPPDFRPRVRRHGVVVMVEEINAATLDAIAYARSLDPDYAASVTVVHDDASAERIEKAWAVHEIDMPLEIVRAADGDLTSAGLAFIEELRQRWRGATLTVVLPELFVEHWWQHVLHNQSALLLKGRLLRRPNTVVTSVPYSIAATNAGAGAPT